MKSKIYVGIYDKSPVSACCPLATTHPKNFQAEYDSQNFDGYTNNVLFVDCVACEDVWVIGQTGSPKQLSCHPDWKKWQNEMNSGEFWSFVGEDWDEPMTEAELAELEELRNISVETLEEAVRRNPAPQAWYDENY